MIKYRLLTLTKAILTAPKTALQSERYSSIAGYPAWDAVDDTCGLQSAMHIEVLPIYLCRASNENAEDYGVHPTNI